MWQLASGSSTLSRWLVSSETPHWLQTGTSTASLIQTSMTLGCTTAWSRTSQWQYSPLHSFICPLLFLLPSLSYQPFHISVEMALLIVTNRNCCLRSSPFFFLLFVEKKIEIVHPHLKIFILERIFHQSIPCLLKSSLQFGIFVQTLITFSLKARSAACSGLVMVDFCPVP